MSVLFIILLLFGLPPPVEIIEIDSYAHTPISIKIKPEPETIKLSQHRSSQPKLADKKPSKGITAKLRPRIVWGAYGACDINKKPVVVAG